MTGMFERINALVARALADMGSEETAFELKPAKDVLHGDLALNAAFQAARALRRSPQDVAQALADALQGEAGIEAAAVAGGGFVNLRLEEDFMLRSAREMIAPERAHKPRHVVICAEAGDLRQRWAAQAMARLGAEIWEGSAKGGWETALEPLIGTGGPFGEATAQERAVMGRDLAQIWSAKDHFGEISFLATTGSAFRPGLYEAALKGQGPALRAVGLAPISLTVELNVDLESLARLYVMSQRADRSLEITETRLRAPDNSNPAFLANYAFALLRRVPERAAGAPLSDAERRMICQLCRFGSVLQLSRALAEPYRIGLYLIEIAHSFLALKEEQARRGEKAIASEIIHAAMIVFSQSFAILEATPLDEIT